MTIQPTAIYPPGSYTPPPNQGGYQGGRYWTYYTPNPPTEPNFPRRTWNSIPQQPPRPATLPHKMPQFLANRAVVFSMWIIAMITVGFDEWHNLGILPRPARLWDTSLVYGVLVLLGFVDVMVPISNALAIGFTFQLVFQYFQGNITPQGAVGAQGQSVQGGTSLCSVMMTSGQP
jgi:hypothetical protein